MPSASRRMLKECLIPGILNWLDTLTDKIIFFLKFSFYFKLRHCRRDSLYWFSRTDLISEGPWVSFKCECASSPIYKTQRWCWFLSLTILIFRVINKYWDWITILVYVAIHGQKYTTIKILNLSSIGFNKHAYICILSNF